MSIQALGDFSDVMPKVAARDSSEPASKIGSLSDDDMLNEVWNSFRMVFALSKSSSDPARWGIVAYWRDTFKATSGSGTELKDGLDDPRQYIHLRLTGIASQSCSAYTNDASSLRGDDHDDDLVLLLHGFPSWALQSDRRHYMRLLEERIRVRFHSVTERIA